MAVHIAAGFTGTAYSTRNPRIGWRRITGTVAASTEAAGFAAVNAATPRTDSFWRPTSATGTWRLDAGSAVPVSYVGIAAHDLGTQAATVLVQSSTDDSNWTTRLTLNPTDDSAILGLFASVTARYWRISITAASAAPTIGVIQFGAVTEVPHLATYAPSVSLERTRQATYSVNVTEGGQWAGRSVVRRSLAPQMAVSHLSEAWVAAEWDAFAAHAETGPFFIADRPADYPKSAAYAWTTGDLRPERSVAKAGVAYSVTLALVGLLE